MLEDTTSFVEIARYLSILLGILLAWEVHCALRSIFKYFRVTLNDPTVPHAFKWKLALESIFILTILIFAIKEAIIGELLIFIIFVLCDIMVAIILYHAFNLSKQVAYSKLNKYENDLSN